MVQEGDESRIVLRFNRESIPRSETKRAPSAVPDRNLASRGKRKRNEERGYGRPEKEGSRLCSNAPLWGLGSSRRTASEGRATNVGKGERPSGSLGDVSTRREDRHASFSSSLPFDVPVHPVLVSVGSSATLLSCGAPVVGLLRRSLVETFHVEPGERKGNRFDEKIDSASSETRLT